MRGPEKRNICSAVCSLVIIVIAAFIFGCIPLDPVKIAEIIMEPVDSTTYTTCLAEGKIIDRGEEETGQTGFCWSETSLPEVSDNFKTSTNPDAEGMFSAEITGLSAGTNYYIRAYLLKDDTTYSEDQQSFTTRQFKEPTIEIDRIEKKWYDRALVWVNLTDDGGRPVVKTGICWSGQPGPDMKDTVILGNGSESFSCVIKGLLADTKYYVRAFALNAEDTAFSKKDSVFTTHSGRGTGFVTDVRGNEYNTVRLGNQWWMAENMKADKYPDNSDITPAQNTSEWINLTVSSKAFCYYDKSSANRDIYGALYTWAGAMKGINSSAANPSGIQGVCPDEWHIPSDAEWKELEIYLGMSPAEANNEGDRGTDQGGQLKEKGTVHWMSNFGATDSTLFTALPGGWRENGTGAFGTIRYDCYFWTATQSNSNEAWIRNLHDNLTKIGRTAEPKNAGYSVRCVKGLD